MAHEEHRDEDDGAQEDLARPRVVVHDRFSFTTSSRKSTRRMMLLMRFQMGNTIRMLPVDAPMRCQPAAMPLNPFTKTAKKSMHDFWPGLIIRRLKAC